MKRQRTKWEFRMIGKNNTYIKVGWIHNRRASPRDDVIAVRVKSVSGPLGFAMRIDEASAFISGLARTLAVAMVKGRIRLKGGTPCVEQ